jgi:sigma-54 dependent transcriptional regulator, acetoin dehydrogenase operon transcriptional activator AcoR
MHKLEGGLNMAKKNYFSQNVTSAWKRFTTKVDIEEGATRPEIASSWMNCYEAGLDPLGHVNPLFLNRHDFKKLVDEKRNLINLTRKVVTDLYPFVAGSGFIVMLSDERGYIVDIIGENRTMANAAKYHLSIGASWAEEKVGTNGIGTALTIKKPIQISGAEHYCKRNHFWSCSAAPIFDGNGNIMGVLQISGPSFNNHLHTLGLVVSAVESISNQIQLQQYNMELNLHKNRMHNILHITSDGIIVTDKKGAIIQVNPAAEEILVKKEREIRGRPVTEFTDRVKVIQETLIKDDFENISGGIHLIHSHCNIKKFTNENASASFQFENIIGENAQIKKTIELGKIAAKSISHVLLQGESGTGKEVFAQAIHYESSRRNKPFVAVNCGAIPRELIGSELFGFEGGSFTGAKQGGKQGKFELASGGTLFLDEIGEMPLEQQVALLRVLQDQQITRIGGEKNIKVDTRIICATNKNLRLEVTKGNFREDLFYRLNVISINLPPLRERKEDILLLFDLFMKNSCKKLKINFPTIDQKIMPYFQQYDWPGNVRELQNIVERILNLANGARICIEHLPDEMLHPHQVEPPLVNWTHFEIETNSMEKQKIRELLDKQEQKYVMGMLIAANGNISQVARDMGISRNTLYKKLKRLNISTK